MIIFCNSDSTHISDKITDLFSYLTKDTIAKEMRESAYEEVAEYFDDLYLWKEYFEAFPNSSDAFYGLINHSDASFDEIVNSQTSLVSLNQGVSKFQNRSLLIVNEDFEIYLQRRVSRN